MAAAFGVWVIIQTRRTVRTANAFLRQYPEPESENADPQQPDVT